MRPIACCAAAGRHAGGCEPPGRRHAAAARLQAQRARHPPRSQRRAGGRSKGAPADRKESGTQHGGGGGGGPGRPHCAPQRGEHAPEDRAAGRLRPAGTVARLCLSWTGLGVQHAKHPGAAQTYEAALLARVAARPTGRPLRPGPRVSAARGAGPPPGRGVGAALRCGSAQAQRVTWPPQALGLPAPAPAAPGGTCGAPAHMTRGKAPALAASAPAAIDAAADAAAAAAAAAGSCSEADEDAPCSGGERSMAWEVRGCAAGAAGAPGSWPPPWRG